MSLDTYESTSRVQSWPSRTTSGDGIGNLRGGSVDILQWSISGPVYRSLIPRFFFATLNRKIACLPIVSRVISHQNRTLSDWKKRDCSSLHVGEIYSAITRTTFSLLLFPILWMSLQSFSLAFLFIYWNILDKFVSIFHLYFDWFTKFQHMEC